MRDKFNDFLNGVNKITNTLTFTSTEYDRLILEMEAAK